MKGRIMPWRGRGWCRLYRYKMDFGIDIQSVDSIIQVRVGNNSWQEYNQLSFIAGIMKPIASWFDQKLAS